MKKKDETVESTKETKSIMPKLKSLNGTASKSITAKGGFDLDKFKTAKGLTASVKFKETEWLKLSPAFQSVTSLPGIPKGHITLLRGHSDTGKTTAMIEAAVSAQKIGTLPVFIITEMKWNWEHVRFMGFEMEDVVDKETGEVIDHKGFFIYADRSTLSTIENIAAFILDILNEQKKGNLPYDIAFFWDSIGSVPCQMSVEKNSNNPMWNAGAYATQFGNFINQEFPLSRKESSPYTNTLVAINKVGVAPAQTIFEQPKMTNKGGNTMYFDATIVVTFGNIVNSGTSIIKATKNNKNVDFAKRTKIGVSKNHINDVTTKGTIVMTAHGFILDDKKEIDKYKNENKHNWLQELGIREDEDVDVVIEDIPDEKEIDLKILENE